MHALGVAAALFFVLPFVFLFLTSVMSDQQALTRDLWPHTWEWCNYRKVFDTPGFLTWWRNTLVYAVLGTVLTVVSSIPVAYALAKFRFRGRQSVADAGHLDDDAAAAGGRSSRCTCSGPSSWTCPARCGR